MATKKDNLLEIKDGVNLDKIKKELNEYVHKQVDFEVKEVLEKNQKILLRNKSFVIVRRDIVILLLVFLSLYLGYQLYQTGYFNKYYKGDSDKTQINNVPTPVEPNEEPKEEVRPSLDELKRKYGSLLESYVLNSKCDYYDDYYDGNLSSGLKLYFSLSNVDSKHIELDDDSTFVDEERIKEEYNRLFVDDYEGSSFEYEGVQFKYSESRKIYFANNKININSNSDIVREIIDINEDDLSITTVEGLKKDDKLFNPVSNKEVSGSDLTKNMDKFVKVKYLFIKDADTYKLKKIEVIK